jgi:hypothetical protein
MYSSLRLFCTCCQVIVIKVNRMKSYFVIFSFFLFFAACSRTEQPKSSEPAKSAPRITLSRERIPQNGWLVMRGSGFTPKANVQSHLRRPDGTEYPEVSILTDDHGEFSHDIDTLLMIRGSHDLWVVDSTTGIGSNIAHFQATDDQGPPERPIP